MGTPPMGTQAGGPWLGGPPPGAPGTPPPYPPMGPPPAYPPGYGGRPPYPPVPGMQGMPVRRRRLWPVFLVVGLVVVALVGGLLAVGLSVTGGGPSGDQADATANLLRQAAFTLTREPATHYTGEIDDAEGATMHADLKVTNSGSAIGTLSDSSGTVSFVATDGREFLRAPTAFWTSAGLSARRAGLYAKHWIKVDPSDVDIDTKKVLAPLRLGQQLSAAAKSHQVRRGAVGKVNGVRARELFTTAGGVWVTTAKPYRIVRVDSNAAAPATSATPDGYQGRAHVVQVGPSSKYNFDLFVATMPDSAINDLMSQLQQKLDQLKNSLDSTVQFTLDGDVKLSPCGQTSCTANVSLSNTLSTTNKYVKPNQPVTAEVYIYMTLDGASIQECVDEVSMDPGGSTKNPVTCTATYELPSDGETHTIEAKVEAIGKALVEADIKQMADDLAKQSTGLRLREAGEYGLPGWNPTDGPIRYEPPSNYRSGPLPTKNGGYVDKYGNIWEQGGGEGKAAADGYSKEWDVQLNDKKKGSNAWGATPHRNKSKGGGFHLNITPDGHISH
jgi:putative RNase toxin 17 of polymorphic toxin system